MAGGELHPLPRAGRQPPPARHPHATARGAVAPGRVDRRLRRPATAERPGRGLRRDPHLSAAQPAQHQPAIPWVSTLAPRGSAVKLYWSEMSKRFHETAMAVVGDAARLVERGRGQPGGRPVAAVVALLPGFVHLGRDQRDPAQRHWRTGPRAPPAGPTLLNLGTSIPWRVLRGFESMIDDRRLTGRSTADSDRQGCA